MLIESHAVVNVLTALELSELHFAFMTGTKEGEGKKEEGEC